MIFLSQTDLYRYPLSLSQKKSIPTDKVFFKTLRTTETHCVEGRCAFYRDGFPGNPRKQCHPAQDRQFFLP
jgi:hypothetical protein